MSDDDIKAQYGPNATRESVVSRYASSRNKDVAIQAKLAEQMRQWFKDNPPKEGERDYDEKADDYRKSIVAPYVSARVRQLLTKPGETRKQGGKTYRYDGFDWNEVN